MNILKNNCLVTMNYHTKYIALHLPSLITPSTDFRKSKTVQNFMLSVLELTEFQNLLEISNFSFSF